MCRKKTKLIALFAELSRECNSKRVSSILSDCDKQFVQNIIDDETKDSVLHVAAKNSFCKLEVVQLLLRCGADISARNDMMRTPLHVALQQTYYNHEVIEEFLRESAPLDAKDIHGRIPLHIALVNENCDPTVIEALVNKGSDVNQCDAYDEHPLHILFSNKFCNVRSVRVLLEHGAENPFYLTHSLLEQYLTLAHHEDYNVEIIKELISIYDINDYLPKLFILHSLIRYRVCYDFLSYFLHTNEYDLNLPFSDGNTALHIAIQSGLDEKVISLLLKHGLNVNAVGSEGRTALHCAMLNFECIAIKSFEMLLDAGSKTSVIDETGRSPLGMAVQLFKNDPLFFKDHVELLLKFAVKQSFVEDKKWQISRFKKVLCATLCLDVNYDDYGTLYGFIKKCHRELVQMKTDVLQQNFSLLHLISKELYAFNEDTIPNIFKYDISHQYPIYQHCIIRHLPRSLLHRVVHTVHVHSRSGESAKNKSQIIILDSDCVDNLIMYLDKQDLYNLCLAFCPDGGIFKSVSKMAKRLKLC